MNFKPLMNYRVSVVIDTNTHPGVQVHHVTFSIGTGVGVGVGDENFGL